MAVENKITTNSRNAWVSVIVAGVFALIIGAVGGYFSYSFGILGKTPLIHSAGDSNESPFDQTFRGMARFTGLEMSAANCDGSADLPRIVENERHLVDYIELSSNRAKLTPPLNLARAIIAYRSATIADRQHDKQASDSAVQQEKMFLQAAGWTDTSHDHFASVVRDMDGCKSGEGVSEEIK